MDKSGKRWVQRVTINGKRHNIGLGSYRLVSLAEARDNALANAQTIRHGRDPVLEKRQALEESRRLDKPTFAVAAETVIELRRPTWRNAKHSAQWSSTLTTYAFPIIGSKLVDEVDTADVLSVLTRIWVDKPETASRVRQRMETVFDWVIAQGWRQDNPAAQPITKALPKVKRKKKHFKALPYADVPRAGKKVRECSADTSTKLCLEFLILTAARSGEARSAQWQEIDWQELWWTIPPERMKADREHNVPLSRRSVEVLQAAWTISGGGDLIFPASRRNKSLSDMTLLRLLQRQDIPCVVHGYRSSFLTWALELSGEEREVRKTALAHDPDDDDTEMAYIRSYLFDRRRPFMESWAEFICAGVARIE